MLYFNRQLTPDERLVMNRKIFAAALVGAAASFATPAGAVAIVSACSPSQISPDADSCAGWYEGNLLNDSGTHVQDQIDALATIGLNWDGNWAAVDATKVLPTGSTYDFAQLLNGDTWIGVHKGNGGRNGFEGTAFFKLTAVNLDTFNLDLNGGSSAVLYKTGNTGVPEPATWAMMLVGFASVGHAMRRKKAAVARVKFA
jgi:hypothetical protein